MRYNYIPFYPTGERRSPMFMKEKTFPTMREVK